MVSGGDNPYRVRIEDLGPAPEERGTSTEYVAERMRKKPNPYTIEGMIDGIGALSQMAVEEPDTHNGRAARTMVKILLVPFLVGGVLEITGVLHLL
jgi:hypothetical protein